jgi:hypothetical protein
MNAGDHVVPESMENVSDYQVLRDDFAFVVDVDNTKLIDRGNMLILYLQINEINHMQTENVLHFILHHFYYISCFLNTNL